MPQLLCLFYIFLNQRLKSDWNKLKYIKIFKPNQQMELNKMMTKRMEFWLIMQLSSIEIQLGIKVLSITTLIKIILIKKIHILFRLKEYWILVNKEILVKAIIADYNFKKVQSIQSIWLNKIIISLKFKCPQ